MSKKTNSAQSKNNNHSCIQMTKQHLTIKFEGAVIFLA
ncbi:hypothetical protein CHCC14820_2949 [Bacillus paralicheniformis]|nr:hypothetical protein CHCC20347_3808 [Bacillus paralicheniformis]TWM35294.1 hypothetical protein CHCC14820_2949 [Bacillus paralicheniformis]